MIKSSERQKPQKPTPDFPLFAHNSGRWAKKVKGRFYYFGKWEDPDTALDEWLKVKDDLLNGRRPRPTYDGEGGITLGEFCMVGMGSVVTRDVPPFALMAGNPARRLGWVCACGHPLPSSSGGGASDAAEEAMCSRCKRAYAISADFVRLVRDPRGRS